MSDGSISNIDYEKTFGAIAAPIAVKDNFGRILYMNRLAKELSSIAVNDIFPTDSHFTAEEKIDIKESGIIDYEINVIGHEGDVQKRFYKITTFPLLNESGFYVATVYFFYDNTRIAEDILGMLRDINDARFHDFLPKKKLDRILAVEVERASRYETPLSLVSFKFKDFVVGVGGVENPQEVLKGYMKFLRPLFRKTDYFFEMGYNDFLGILPHTNKEHAIKSMEKASRISKEFHMKHDILFKVAEFDFTKHHKDRFSLVEEAKEERDKK